jgi:transcriptional regulator with XRE-family HTH domain
MSMADLPLEGAAFQTILDSIGDQVRDARIARAWQLAELARRIGVSTSVVCRLELARREASMVQLLNVCAALNHRLSDVLRTAEDEAFPHGGAPWA